MNLYLISQELNCNYDTYDSAVVAAASAEEAKAIHPCPQADRVGLGYCGDWVGSPDDVDAKLIGTTSRDPGVILASYNAG